MLNALAISLGVIVADERGQRLLKDCEAGVLCCNRQSSKLAATTLEGIHTVVLLID